MSLAILIIVQKHVLIKFWEKHIDLKTITSNKSAAFK